MKKLLLLSVLFALALTLGRLFTGPSMNASGEGAGGAASENGDCNGDGTRDITDAVHLLSWLFTGGPPPVAVAGGSDLESRVAALEAIVHGCFRFDDRNGDGIPDCGQKIPDGTPCDDGNPCTEAAFFVGGVCRGLAGPDGATCDDGDPGTDQDRCVAGTCRGTPRVLCGDGRCDPGESPTNCPEDCGECQQGQVQSCTGGVGDCAQGIQVCLGGVWGPCEPQVGPMPETCDGRDNDCDGVVDEDFDLSSDPRNCGNCGRNCPPGMVCRGGQCVPQ